MVGGIEVHNLEISRALEEHCNVTRITNPYGKKALLWFFPFALFRALKLRHSYQLVLLGDGLLAPVGRLLQLLQPAPVVCFVHGLDITFQNSVYQKVWVRYCLPRLDLLLPVSTATFQNAIERGIPKHRLQILRNGVNTETDTFELSPSGLKQLRDAAERGTILLSVGRLVRRKGLAWFIDQVLPNLSGDWTLLVAGEGPEELAIREAVHRNHLQDKVTLIGYVSDQQKIMLFQNSHIFVQPNISVSGDMEGFGLVVLEAAIQGLPVIASNIEGLKDAIQDGKNGLLVPERDVHAYLAAIRKLMDDEDGRAAFGNQAQAHTRENFAWSTRARECVEILQSTLDWHRGPAAW